MASEIDDLRNRYPPLPLAALLSRALLPVPVLFSYCFTCALTGYFLNTTKENMVEAAYIHLHADCGNDGPHNGLALTPDAHWLFERGLWTTEPCGGKFIVLVAGEQFKDASPDAAV